MVSFFGLKIGGEKKKKSPRDLQISAPKPQHLNDLTPPDENTFDFTGGSNPAYEASVYSLSRQESGHSTRSIASKFRGLASNKFGSSMIDLPAPPSLRHHASNPSLGRKWNTGSSTSLSLVPPGFHPMARPSTSDGKNKAWVNPLDVHFTQDSSKTGFKGPLSPALTMRDEPPRSPLGQYELKLDLPSDVSSFADFANFNGSVQAPAPLRLKKPAPTRLAVELQMESQSQQKPPSPPQSISEKETLECPIPGSPKIPAVGTRPSTAHDHRSIPSGLEDLKNAISNFVPASLPSPSLTPRASEEEPSTTTISPRPASPVKRGSIKPVIRNVSAKRDTLTINPQRRRSLQMKIEAAGSGNIPSLRSVELSKASNDGRPPPLTLNIPGRLSAADRNGPRSAPFLSNPMRSFTPTSIKSPLRLQIGVEEEASRSEPVQEAHDQCSGAESPTGSSVYDDDDDNVYHHPPSPESTSPVIPLTGPLASPSYPAPLQSPYSHPNTFASSQKDEIDTNGSLSPTTPPVPPRSLRRNPPTPDSSCWPLPSPIASSYGHTTVSSSDSRWRSESESESLFVHHEPLEPPRIPAVRSGAESPTFRSFSRPWTPTAGEFTVPSLRRAETAGPLSRLGTAGEFGGGLRPPPRSVTVKTPRTDAKTAKSVTSRAERNGSGDGFI